MSFDLPADLESRVARYAEESRLSPDEALRQLVEDGLRRKDSPGRTLIGLFSSPEDVALMEEVDEIIRESRGHPRVDVSEPLWEKRAGACSTARFSSEETLRAPPRDRVHRSLRQVHAFGGERP